MSLSTRLVRLERQLSSPATTPQMEANIHGMSAEQEQRYRQAIERYLEEIGPEGRAAYLAAWQRRLG